MAGFTLKAIDDMEATYHGAVRLAGAELGVRSFGVQVLAFPPGFEDYPEHDHAEDGQEEVYVVLEGGGAFEVDGERVPVQVGQMLHVAAETRRKLWPGPDGVTVLAIGGVPGGTYRRPDGFELEVRA